MAVGVIAQGLARHMAIPGIVLLLAVGVLLGPDFANLIRPETLGSGMSGIVGVAVAVILFEGGLNLKLSVLREQASPIRRLVTVGAVVTAIGGALAAVLWMPWGWRLAVLFGTLVIVTGPTVVTPLIRRIRLDERVATILEAEGIFIDAVGATIAVVALEVTIAQTRSEVGLGLASIVLGPATGMAVGGVMGLALAALLRKPRLVPPGLHNVLALAVAVLAFELSDAIVHESGIAAAIAAGMVVGNSRSHALREIVTFKEQLTVLLVATLFVLLAADVRLADVEQLGWPGVATVVTLAFVVRPICVAICTWGTGLSLREKLFLSWLAPRGIVAAAVASLFAIELGRVGIEGGEQLKALVFLVIACTVTLQGLTSGVVARLLGVSRPRRGALILGANPLGVLLAQLFRKAGHPAVLVDSNADACVNARGLGIEARCGNGLEEVTLRSAGADRSAWCIGLTANDSINYAFARRVKELFHGVDVAIALDSRSGGLSQEAAREGGAKILFHEERALGWWSEAQENGDVLLETWVASESVAEPAIFSGEEDAEGILPLLLISEDEVGPVHDDTRLQKGDRLVVAIAVASADVARASLEAAHLRPAVAKERLDPTHDDATASKDAA